MAESRHIPVLVAEVIAGLRPEPGEVYVDATAGDGGHAAAMAVSMGGRGMGAGGTPAPQDPGDVAVAMGGVVVLNDLDPSRLEFARARVEAACANEGVAPPRLVHMHGNFASLADRITAVGLRANMVLADLGFSSAQMGDSSRGLSFDRDGPLDMRLDPTSPVSAADLVRDLPEDELARIIREYGEERFARGVAGKIAAARVSRPIMTTLELAEVVRSAIPRATWGRIDPATRTFQALRIAVNDELGNLSALLASVGRAAVRVKSGEATWLAPGARVAIISFHSLEDRLVKRSFADLASRGLAGTPTRAIRAGDEEVTCNPRARSATLRVLTLVG